MKAIMKVNEARGFELCDIEEPVLSKSTDVKLEVLKSSVCGTDYHIYSWDNWSQKTIKVPQVNGHEVLARIVEVGSEVTNFTVGQIVVCETHIYCGTCYQCQTGNAHVCSNMSILGVNQDGIWCEYQVVPQNILVDVSGIDPKYAGIMEPLGNAIHTLGYSDVRGKNVLISGAGPIGVLAAYVAKISGASTVMISDFNQYRLDMVRNMDFGAEVIDLNTDDIFAKSNAITAGSGIDIAIEMSGNAKALDTSIQLINPGGEINVLSIYPTDKIEVAMNDLVFKNIKLQTVTGRKLFETWYAASRWLRNDVLEASKLDFVITHQFKMEEFEQMFEVMETGKCGKMILDFSYLHEGE